MPGVNDPGMTLLFGRELLGLGDPAIDAAGQTDLFADIVRGLLVELGDLLIVEDAEIVELLLDRARNAGQLLEVVGDAARTGELLEAETFGCWRGRDLLGDDRLLLRADVDAEIALRARDAVDGGLRDQLAVERDGAAGVVIAGHGVSDALRIAVGVDDGRHRNAEALGLLDRDVFLVGVDHEQQVGHAAHVANAAERAVELVALALHREALLLGVTGGFTRIEHLVELAQARDRARNRLPVGQRAAEPARVDVVLRRTLRGVGNRVLRLALCADEEDAAAFGNGVAHGLERAMQHRHGLGQVDDVDVIAGAADVLTPLRVSAGGLIAEV